MVKKLSFWAIIVMLISVLAVGCGGGQAADVSDDSADTAAEDTSLQDVLDKGYFTLGLDDSFPPMGFRDESGEIVGFDIDLANEVASRMGVDLKIQPISWDAKTMELNNGNIDVIWNGLTITDDRKEEMSFSKPYLNNNQIIIVNADSDIDTKADLEGKKVAVQLDSSAQKAVEANKTVTASLAELVKFDDNQTAIMDLETSGVDAVVVDQILGRYIIAKKPDSFKVASEDFGSELYGIGFRLEDNAFREEVDRILDEMRADGKTAEISTQWFGEDIVLSE